MSAGGLNCRLSSDTLGLQARKQEALLQDYKIYAALAYSRANRLNRTTIDAPDARLDIVASGKSYMDVLEARVIASRIERFHRSEQIRDRLAFPDARETVLQKAVATPSRPAWYCSGCPHNRSTKVPGGSLALAGIGCHVMATAIYPEHNKTMTQMGGEGATCRAESGLGVPGE
jgi:TPP-dependent indolepyruvate ferredoxin oxidoreductase alpha subunit